MCRGEGTTQDLALQIWAKVRDDSHIVLSAYLVISSEKPSGTKYTKQVKEYKWQPIGMSDLKEIKQTIVSYSFHLW